MTEKNDLDIVYLSKKVNSFGDTRAHIMASEGFCFPLENFEILSMKNNFGHTVAHVMAEKGFRFPLDRLDILSLKNRFKYSVARTMVKKGFYFPLDRMEILSMKNGYNEHTIAHIMAENNFIFPSDRFDILFLTNRDFQTVLSCMKNENLEKANFPTLENVSEEKIRKIIFELKNIKHPENFKKFSSKKLKIIFNLFQKYGNVHKFKTPFYEFFLREYNIKKQKNEILNF